MIGWDSEKRADGTRQTEVAGKKHQKMSKRQTERDARSERPTFTGIIRVH